MTETKFTPGPWKWQRQNEQEWPSYDLSPGVLTKDTADGTPWGDEIDRANAHMIAAAPDLYGAVCKSNCPRPANGRPDEFSALQCYEARECGCFYGTAIAKARGKE